MGSNNFRNAPARARLACGAGSMLALPLALLASPPAVAQTASPACAMHPVGAPRVIRPGTCVRSALDGNDPTIGSDFPDVPVIPYEDWTLTLRAGEAVRIEMDAILPDQPAEPAEPATPTTDDAMTDLGMEAFGFDTFLELRRAGVAEPLASNDDRPGSLNSRIDFTATEAGDYVVRARPLWNAEAGGYTLRVGTAPPPPVATALADGVTRLSIAPNAPQIEAMPGYRGALYAFQATAGERVRITADADAEMLMMELTGPDGMPIATAFQEPVESRIPNASRDAVMMAALPTAGRYQLQLYVPEGQDAVPVALTLERGRAVAARAPRRLRLGETVDGEIGLQSSLIADPGLEGSQSFVEIFELPVRAGEPISVAIESPGFMQMVEAGVMSPIGFATAVIGDVGGGTPLVLTPSQTGTITLRVRPVGNGGGRFRLTVSPAQTPPAEAQ